MKILILTVGLPRSGKSTWAAKKGFPIVSPDAIRLAMHGQSFKREAEPAVWHVARLMVKSLFLAGHDRVILDATSVKRQYRMRWKDPDWELRFKAFDTPASVCVERAKGDATLIGVIIGMDRNLEPLAPDEKPYGVGKKWKKRIKKKTR